MNIKIIVAAHKKYAMPEEDIYLPLHVGKSGKQDIGFTGDDTGDNISEKNPYYCELTGLYWAWKNLESDYIGLVHYRRLLALKKGEPLTKSQAESLLKKNDIILPKKRNYYIENLYSHYANTLYVQPLDRAGEIIREKYPEYSAEFEKLKTRTSAHMFNMAVMSREKLNEYCNWLFDILAGLEKDIDPKQYDSFHARYLGRVSELLFDVWLNTKGYDYSEVPVWDVEGENIIKKGIAFLKAKFLKKKYSKSM